MILEVWIKVRSLKWSDLKERVFERNAKDVICKRPINFECFLICSFLEQ